jgi:hypothetical protein
MKPFSQTFASVTITTTTLIGSLCLGTEAATLTGEYLSKNSGRKVSSSMISLQANLESSPEFTSRIQTNSSLLRIYDRHVVIDAIATGL